MYSINYISVIYLFIVCCAISSFAYPDPGKLDLKFNNNYRDVKLAKSLFKDSQVKIQVFCTKAKGSEINVGWSISQTKCLQNGMLQHADGRPEAPEYLPDVANNGSKGIPEIITKCECGNHSLLCELKAYEEPAARAQAAASDGKLPYEVREKRENQVLSQVHRAGKRPVYRVPEDGFYLLRVEVILPNEDPTLDVDVHIGMLGEHGYLSAADWPLLPFYGAMCLVYVALGVAWLTVSFLQWRDLLRIQFWIGGVILLGMLEKAMFYAEYQNINTTGKPVAGAMLLAELVSCGKRTLARMLVIIVSLGFGIVKPRLGAMLHRVVGTGIVYFILAASNAYIQVIRPKNDPSNQLLIANVPLAVLDSAICWWIFTSLVQTTRTLRLRRNVVKLNLYRHFTTTLIFAVLSSIIFMLYSIRIHHFSPCFTNWKEVWVDEAFWRLLFSVILLVIMILWRPTNNNQRYAFTPLLDAPEDDDDDEEEQFVNDAYGVKMRAPSSGASSPKQKGSTNSAEEDLKWVEENIPTSLADSALPILDSDEEIMNTKFEISKMQ